MTSTARRAFVIVAAVATGAAACNSPAATPPSGMGTIASPVASAPAPSASPSGAPSSSVPAAPAQASLPKGVCSTDADCRLQSSYCADTPCACLVLGKGDVAPACSGTQVRCFADPCMKKSARCDGGKCVLSTAGATDR